MPRYIDAEKAKETLKHFCLETANNSVGTVIGYPSDIYADVAENRIDTWVDLIQTADVRENVHGKWLFDDGRVATGELQDKNVHCSICGHSAPSKPWWECHLELTKFCPNCGAQMEEKGECG